MPHAAGLRASLPARLRLLLRDPIYRGECRLFGRLIKNSVALGIVACLAAPSLGLLIQDGLTTAILTLFWLPVLVLPALLTAESLLTERSSGTVESILLTPVARDRLLWTKVLARGRSCFLAAALCPVLGAVLSITLWCLKISNVPWPTFVLAGFALGLAVGLFLAGQALTAGALGIYFAVRFRKRIFIYFMCLVAIAGLHLLEFMAIACVVGTLLAIGDMSHRLPMPQVAVLALVWAGIGLVAAARVALVNLVLPDALLAHAGCQFDRRHLLEKT